MRKKYIFNYDNGKAFATFQVDINKYTNEHANETLAFFLWDWDKEEDPIDEVMRKYALEAIQLATSGDLSLQGVIWAFDDHEGWCPVDGSVGITLIAIRGFEFDDLDLELVLK